MNAQDKTFKGFLIIWLGQLMSAIGSGLTAFALGVYGVLSQTVGQIIGTGQGRGIGFLFVISGLLVSILALIIGLVNKIGALELIKVG